MYFIPSGAKDIVVNPKVNNMLNGYDKAQYPLLMISDSSIKSEYLRISRLYN